ncbi:MAG: ribosome assembly cofactor RimP [Ginsengibacter sp.]
MNFETPLKKIRDFLDKNLTQSETDFLVDVKINQGNNIIVLLDADDGITIQKCSQVNKVLYKYIEETEFFPGGNFSLEVSSPGIDEPLKLHRQYKKNIGRNVQVLINDGTSEEGKLIEVNDNEIIIEQKEGKGSKLISNLKTISFNQIKHTKVLITF